MQLAGSAIFASGRGGKGLLISATKGESWRAVKLPTKKTRIRSASFSGKRRRATLRKAKGKVTISGKLAGAVGGERVTVSARAITGTDWTSRTVTAGANGGSFSATFTIKHAAVFVGQWAGDSGRAGVGSKPLLVRFR
ncbi:MAG: hypothetical protein QOG56_2533 [Solirubrobacteraceae bacterium]|nr:hypothetical protein [Solirubrobacteraceae bacterium]